MHIRFFDTIDSTSLQARREIDANRGPSRPTTLIAVRQSGAVGRLGRTWHSPAGGLWMTTVWPAPAVVDSLLAIRVGLGIVCAVETTLELTPPVLNLKWPNDILWGDKKVAGILIESLCRKDRAFLLVGIGINANFAVEALPTDLHATATTLQIRAGHPLDLERLRTRTIGAVEMAITRPETDLDAAASRLWGLHRSMTVSTPSGTRLTGVMKGLSPAGALILEAAGETLEIQSIETLSRADS